MADSGPGKSRKAEKAGRVEKQPRPAEPQPQAIAGRHADVLKLQQAAGNRAVGRLIQQVVNGDPGQPLDPAVRQSMESRFGEDFGQVRVHDDAQADQSARAVDARAYTVGPHIVFGAGEYAPGTGEGRAVLAHELAHVVQHARAARITPEISRAGDPHEHAAEQAAAQMTGGVFAGVQAGEGGTAPAIQRIARDQPRPASSQDATQAMLVRSLYANPQVFSIPDLIEMADRLNARLLDEQPGEQTKVEIARALVAIHRVLRQREDSAQRDPDGALLQPEGGKPVPWQPNRPKEVNKDIWPFADQAALQQWYSLAGETPLAFAQAVLPAGAPAQVSTGIAKRPLTPQEQASGPGSVAPKFQEALLSGLNQEKIGGGPSIQAGLEALRGTTLGDVRTAIGSTLKGTQPTTEPNDNVSLYDATGLVFFVTRNRVFIIDRSGHIMPGDPGALSLTTFEKGGTYFHGEFGIQRGAGGPSVGVSTRVDTRPTVVGGDVHPRFTNRDLLARLLPSAQAAAHPSNPEHAPAGIAVIVAPQEDSLASENVTSKLKRAVLGAHKHVWWALNIIVQQEITRWKKRLGGQVLEEDVWAAINKVAALHPLSRMIMDFFDKLQMVEEYANLFNIVRDAQSDDELDIVSQNIALKVAHQAVEHAKEAIKSRVVGAVQAGIGKLAGKAGKEQGAPPKTAVPPKEENQPPKATTPPEETEAPAQTKAATPQTSEQEAAPKPPVVAAKPPEAEGTSKAAPPQTSEQQAAPKPPAATMQPGEAEATSKTAPPQTAKQPTAPVPPTTAPKETEGEGAPKPSAGAAAQKQAEEQKPATAPKGEEEQSATKPSTPGNKLSPEELKEYHKLVELEDLGQKKQQNQKRLSELQPEIDSLKQRAAKAREKASQMQQNKQEQGGKNVAQIQAKVDDLRKTADELEKSAQPLEKEAQEKAAGNRDIDRRVRFLTDRPTYDAGGSYKNVRDKTNGGEVNHSPAVAASPLKYDEGPAIWMDKKDHDQCLSTGSSNAAIAHREKQAALIQQGKFLEAQQLDIDDIRSRFGDKYDKSIQQMVNYTKKLIADGKIKQTQ